MNCDLNDDDIVSLEPPLGPRLSTACSRSPLHSTDFSLNYDQVFGGPNCQNQDRGSMDGYDSDQIDPDLEELLYSSIHHQTIDSMELSFDTAKHHHDSQPVPAPIVSPKSPKSVVKDTVEPPKSVTPHPDGYAIFNHRKVAKKELRSKLKRLQLAKEKATAAADAAVQFKVEQTRQLDLSFGNLIGCDVLETTLDPVEAMNKFYNEDSYDSDEERANMKRMSSDRRLWKVGQEDLMANFGRRSGSWFRDRQKQCRQCGGGGHLVKDCPRKQLCYICGDTRHIGQKCRLRVCAICFEPGHLSHKCPIRYNLKEVTCNTCHQQGHTEEQCTQSWRKFLAITDEATYLAHLNSKVITNDTVTVNSTVSCANCGAWGKHFACECPQKTMDNMRFQMPPPVNNWRTIRKNQASNRKDLLPKGRARNSVSRAPTASTSTSYAAQNGHSIGTSQFKNHQLKGNKRPLDYKMVDSDSEPEVINLSDSDSDDSVQYVLSLLKNSTKVNDSPMTNCHMAKGKKSRASSSKMNLNISTKKKQKSSKSHAKATPNKSDRARQSKKGPNTPTTSKKKRHRASRGSGTESGPSKSTPNGFQGIKAQSQAEKMKQKLFNKRRCKREHKAKS